MKNARKPTIPRVRYITNLLCSEAISETVSSGLDSGESVTSCGSGSD